MEAIKKKMQAMKVEKDNLMDRCDTCEQVCKRKVELREHNWNIDVSGLQRCKGQARKNWRRSQRAEQQVQDSWGMSLIYQVDLGHILDESSKFQIFRKNVCTQNISSATRNAKTFQSMFSSIPILDNFIQERLIKNELG